MRNIQKEYAAEIAHASITISTPNAPAVKQKRSLKPFLRTASGFIPAQTARINGPPDTDYPTVLPISIIGRYIAVTKTPTIIPIPTIIIGSIIPSIVLIAISTSSS